MLKQHNELLSLAYKFSHFFIISLSWLISYYIRFNIIGDSQEDLLIFFIKLLPVLFIITYWNFYKDGLYKSQRFNTTNAEIFKTVKANTFSLIMFIVVLYFFANNRVSRATIIIYFLISTFTLVVATGFAKYYLKKIRRKNFNLRHVTIVGNNPNLLTYLKRINSYRDTGIRIRSWLYSDSMAKEHNINDSIAESDLYIVSFKNEDKHKEYEFLKEHYNNVTPIKVIPDISYSLIGHEIEDFRGVPLISYNTPSFNPIEMLLKESIDFIIVLTGLVIISPLLFIISIFIKLSSKGPILYHQERVTKDGKTFKMWKFRTMTEAKDDEDKNQWGSKGNNRITKVGNVLRKTSLDELPQLFNILKGEMSLVGPRPERIYFVSQFKQEIPNYMLRHKMKAGLTGWAQINGLRGDTDIKTRIEYDLYYIKHWSIWLDVKIILLTFAKGLIHKNAY